MRDSFEASALAARLSLPPLRGRRCSRVHQAMASREQRYVLESTVQIDDAYLGGEHSGGKASRGSENKVPFVAAVPLSKEGHPLRAKLSFVAGFSLNAIEQWAKANLASGYCVHSDGLACFNAVTLSAVSDAVWSRSISGEAALGTVYTRMHFYMES